MPRMLAAWLIAVAAMTVMFVIAIAIAVNMAPGNAMADTQLPMQLVELSKAIKDTPEHTSASQGAANAKCALLAELEKHRCDSESASQSKPRVEVDTALYRAHRQLP